MYHTLPIPKLHVYQLCLLIHKWYECKYTLRHIFHQYFVYNVDIHSYNTRFTSNLHLIRINTTYDQRSIKFKCPTVRNSLPSSLRNLTLNKFKSGLKEFLLADLNYL